MGIPFMRTYGCPWSVGWDWIVDRVTIEVPDVANAPNPGGHHVPCPRTTTPVLGPHASAPPVMSDHELGTDIWAFPKSTGNHPAGVAASSTTGLRSAAPSSAALTGCARSNAHTTI